MGKLVFGWGKYGLVQCRVPMRFSMALTSVERGKLHGKAPLRVDRGRVVCTRDLPRFHCKLCGLRESKWIQLQVVNPEIRVWQDVAAKRPVGNMLKVANYSRARCR